MVLSKYPNRFRTSPNTALGDWLILLCVVQIGGALGKGGAQRTTRKLGGSVDTHAQLRQLRSTLGKLADYNPPENVTEPIQAALAGIRRVASRNSDRSTALSHTVYQ